MTPLQFSVVVFVINVFAVLILLGRYYIVRLDEAREETNFWRRKAEQLDKPGAP